MMLSSTSTGLGSGAGGRRQEIKEWGRSLWVIHGVSFILGYTFFLHFSLHRSSVDKPCPLMDRSGNFSEFLSEARSSTGANGVVLCLVNCFFIKVIHRIRLQDH